MIKSEEIISAVLRGAVKAGREYMKWTGGFTVHDHGVEGFISQSIAASLYQKYSDGYVGMELTFDFIKERSLKKAKRGPMLKEMRGRPRADVALFNSNGWAIGVMEVKRKIQFNLCEDDIGRIKAILKTLGKKSRSVKAGYGSIKVGCVVGLKREMQGAKQSLDFYKKDFKKKVEAMHADLRCDVFSRRFNVPKKFIKDSDFKNVACYHAICVQLRLKHKAV